MRLGPGSEYERVALEALIAAMRGSDLEMTRNEYGWFGGFTNRAAEVVPILLKALENPNVREDCIYSLKRLGAAAELLIKAAIARGEVTVLQLQLNPAESAFPQLDHVEKDVLQLTDPF